MDEKKTQEAHHISGSQQPFGGAPHGRLQRQGSTNTTTNDARGSEIRDSQLYKRILGQSLKQVGLDPREDGSRHNSVSESAGPPNGSSPTPHIPPPKSSGGESSRSEVHIPGFTEAQNSNLVREVAEMAATAATIAARDVARAPRKASVSAHLPPSTSHKPPTIRAGVVHDPEEPGAEVHADGGHDAPNWSRAKSAIILCGATVLYAAIAEILVNKVDVILDNMEIQQKFLGITLFALVPNTTEFLASISELTPLTSLTLTERYILRYEWQYCLVDGNWICICTPSLLASNTSSGPVQCRVCASDLGGKIGRRLYVQPHLSPVGHGHSHLVRFSSQLHVRRREEQLLQGLHSPSQLPGRYCWVLVLQFDRCAKYGYEPIRRHNCRRDLQDDRQTQIWYGISTVIIHFRTLERRSPISIRCAYSLTLSVGV